jgi:hypothetical protein
MKMAWEAYNQAVEQFMKEQELCKQIPPMKWRVFYNSNGNIIKFSGQRDWGETDEAWIEIDDNMAANLDPSAYLVLDNRLIRVDSSRQSIVKLVESSSGEWVAYDEHMCLVIESGDKYNANIKRYTAQRDNGHC